MPFFQNSPSSIRLALVLLCLSLSPICALSSSSRSHFDYYLLSLTWTPTFCASHSSPQCAASAGFVLHGLWPQHAQRGYPSFCRRVPAAPMSLAAASAFPSAALAQHEWKKHGSCTGLVRHHAIFFFAFVCLALAILTT